MKKSSDDKKRDEILKRMLQTPHKPHVDKSPARRKKEKSDDSPAKKSRRPKT